MATRDSYSESQQDIQEAIHCPICSRPYKSPKVLPCLHVFCAECVQELVRNRHGQAFLQCPKCPKSIEIPEPYTVTTLPPSLHHRRLMDLRLLENPHHCPSNCGSCSINTSVVCYCFQCAEFLCIECLNAHHLVKILKEHRVVKLNKFQPKDVRDLLRKPLRCSEKTHEEQTYEFLCNDCNKCICDKCVLSSHQGHGYVSLAIASENKKPHLIDGIKKLKSRIPVCERQTRRANEAILLLERSINNVRREIQKRIASIMDILKSHEMKMMAKLDNIHKEQFRKFSAQRKHFESQKSQLNECIEFCHSVLERNLDTEIVQTYPFITRRFDEMDKATHESTTKSPEVVTVSYIVDKNVDETVQQSKIGNIHVSLTDVDNSTVEGRGLHEGYPNLTSQFTVVTGTSSGRMCYAKGDSVTVKVCGPQSQFIHAGIDDRKDGRYVVSFVPHYLGSHDISVSVNDKTLKGSPFHLEVSDRYTILDIFGATGASDHLFQQPRAIATSSCGELAIADSGNHRIQLFDCQRKQPKYLRHFGSPGNQKGGIKWPSGVAFDGENNILVSDTENNRIQIFSKDRDITISFGQNEVENPQGICVTDKGQIAVCSGGQNPGIKLFSENGKLLRHFNNTENGRMPAYITYQEGRYFVSYSDGNVVKVFDDNGSFLYNIQLTNIDSTAEHRPRGLTIDCDNNLLVGDCKGLGIQIFSLDGKFISKFGEEPEKFGLCRYVDLAATDDGRLFVLQDYGFSNRIRIFH